MPSISNVQFALNLPPVGGSLIVKPTIGDALTTPFSIILTGWSDPDFPISYKFHLYKSQALMEADLSLGKDN
jgi:hypothetical protein